MFWAEALMRVGCVSAFLLFEGVDTFISFCQSESESCVGC